MGGGAQRRMQAGDSRPNYQKTRAMCLHGVQI